MGNRGNRGNGRILGEWRIWWNKENGGIRQIRRKSELEE